MILVHNESDQHASNHLTVLNFPLTKHAKLPSFTLLVCTLSFQVVFKFRIPETTSSKTCKQCDSQNQNHLQVLVLSVRFANLRASNLIVIFM